MTTGFVGLGAMGGPIATNMANSGVELRVYDIAGTAARAPLDAGHGASIEDLAGYCTTVFLCVPNGNNSATIVKQIVASTDSKTQTIIDLSTIGVSASKHVAGLLADSSCRYIDCPVSGGRAGAVAGTITLFWAGPEAQLEYHREVLESISGNIFRVGDRPGQGQALKLLNNFLSATAMAATSEAILFGLSQGLDMKIMLDAVNVSTGMNTATKDKFVNRILTGSYDAGFKTALMKKDVDLYRQGVEAAGTPMGLCTTIDTIWTEVNAARPHGDFTEIFKHLRSVD